MDWALSNRNGSIRAAARVPGCAHTDLLAAGVIGEPNFGRNTELQRWVASESFSYRASFSVPALVLAHRNVDLQLSGLDTAVAVALSVVGNHTALTAGGMRLQNGAAIPLRIMLTNWV